MLSYYFIRNPYKTRLWEDILMTGDFELSGIRSHPAKKVMQNIQPGDKALFYNKNENKQVMGVLLAKSAAYADPKDSTGKWTAVAFHPEETLEKPVSLSQIRELREFKESPVIKIPQLSVAEITEEQFRVILNLSK